MNEYSRNPGDTSWLPQIGEPVEVKHSAIAYTGVKNSLCYVGVLESIYHGEEELEYTIRMANTPFGDHPWYVTAVLEELEPVAAERRTT